MAYFYLCHGTVSILEPTNISKSVVLQSALFYVVACIHAKKIHSREPCCGVLYLRLDVTSPFGMRTLISLLQRCLELYSFWHSLALNQLLNWPIQCLFMWLSLGTCSWLTWTLQWSQICSKSRIGKTLEKWIRKDNVTFTNEVIWFINTTRLSWLYCLSSLISGYSL